MKLMDFRFTALEKKFTHVHTKKYVPSPLDSTPVPKLSGDNKTDSLRSGKKSIYPRVPFVADWKRKLGLHGTRHETGPEARCFCGSTVGMKASLGPTSTCLRAPRNAPIWPAAIATEMVHCQRWADFDSFPAEIAEIKVSCVRCSRVQCLLPRWPHRTLPKEINRSSCPAQASPASPHSQPPSSPQSFVAFSLCASPSAQPSPQPR